MSVTPDPLLGLDRDGPPALRRLVVGVDGSDASGAACAFGLRLADRARAEILVLHACAQLGVAAQAAHTAEPGLLIAAAEQRLAETAEWQRRLQNLADYAGPDAVVQTRVVRDRPAAALLAAATRLEADLVLVGSRGMGAIRGRLLGSVSSHVVEHAPCSVMVFPEDESSAPRRVSSVIVGVDGSPGADVAIVYGEALSLALSAELVLVHGATRTSGETSPAVEAARRVPSARAETSDGHPRDVLVDAADRWNPAVLVVGTRGLGGVEGLLVGSTSRWLVNHAPCPVLVARARRHR
jgi:nucleotide-binding universal stress UspA family protein